MGLGAAWGMGMWWGKGPGLGKCGPTCGSDQRGRTGGPSSLRGLVPS